MKKRFVSLLAVLLALALAGCGWITVSEPGETSAPAPAPSESAPEPVINPLLEADFKTADVMNGFNTEKIGEYGYIEISKSDMATITGDQLVEFCESKVDGSGLNWVWIMFEDGTGIHIAPGSWIVQMEYGVTNAEDRSFSAIGSIARLQENGEFVNAFEYRSYEDKAEIQAAVEALVDDEYKGQSYSCDIFTASGASGYIVSLQIDVPAGPPESSEIVAALESAVNGLGDERIAEVQITAVKDMQIVDGNT